MPKEYFNPPELFPSLQYGFSQLVSASAGKTVYLSGQVGWNEREEMAAGDDLGAQMRQSLRNIDIAMRAAGGMLHDVVSMRIYIVEEKRRETRVVADVLKEFFPPDRAPATTWIIVRGLANEEFLIEIEAVGVIEDAR